jgi:O-antigen/teichoic acid export membrane protein
MADADLKSKVVSGVAWYGGSRVVLQAFTWATTIVVARVVPPADYGLLGMALVYLGLVDFLNELGFGAAIVQRSDLDHRDLDTLFWFGLASGVTLYLATVAFAPAVGGFFGQPRVAELLVFLGLSLVLTGLRTVPWNLLTRAVDFRRRSVVEVTANLAGSLVTIGLALQGFGVWALALGYLLPQLVMTLGAFVQTGWRPRGRPRLASLRRHVAYSAGVAGTRFAWYLNEAADRLIVGRMLGERALGVYTLAIRIGAEMPARLVQVLNQVAFPAYSRLQDDPARASRYFLTSVRLVALVLFPTSLGLAVVAPELVPLLLTDRWSDLVQPLQLVSVGALLRTLQSLAGPLVLARGHSWLALRFNLLCLAVLVPAYVVGARAGLVGVCLAWVTAYPLLTLRWVFETRPIIGYSWRELWEALRAAVLGSGFMLGALAGARVALHSVGPLPRLAGCIGAGALAYVMALHLVEPGLPRELRRKLRPSGAASAP